MITPTPPRKSGKKREMPESKIQSECFVWFWNTYPEYRGVYFAVMNENERSKHDSASQRKVSGALRRMRGVVAGVSDNIGLIPNRDYHGFCAECKTPTGKQSESQKNWEREVRRMGFYYFVYRSLDEFKREVTEYLSLAYGS